MPSWLRAWTYQNRSTHSIHCICAIRKQSDERNLFADGRQPTMSTMPWTTSVVCSHYVLAHPCPVTQQRSQHEQLTSSQSAAKKSIERWQNSTGTAPTKEFLAKIRVRKLLRLLNAAGISPVSEFQSKATYSVCRFICRRHRVRSGCLRFTNN